jgi:hypothetical protein
MTLIRVSEIRDVTLVFRAYVLAWVNGHSTSCSCQWCTGWWPAVAVTQEEVVAFSCSALRAPWSPRSERRPDANGEGGERAVSAPHEDELHRLIIDDAHHAASPMSVDCGEGRDDWRGCGSDGHGGATLWRAIGDGLLPRVKAIRQGCMGSAGVVTARLWSRMHVVSAAHAKAIREHLLPWQRVTRWFRAAPHEDGSWARDPRWSKGYLKDCRQVSVRHT